MSYQTINKDGLMDYSYLRMVTHFGINPVPRNFVNACNAVGSTTSHHREGQRTE